MHARHLISPPALSLVLALATVTLACGGGSGGDAVTCADVAAKAVGCNSLDTVAYVQRVCRHLACPDKRQVLECMATASCAGYPANCVAGASCTPQADCGTFTDAAVQCSRSRSGTLDGDTLYMACGQLTCGDDAFFGAVSCAAGAATSCGNDWQSAANVCFTSRGCSALFPE